MVCVSVPELPVTVMVELPAGVPVFEPAFGKPPEHPLKYPSDTINKAKAAAQETYRAGLCDLFARLTPTNSKAIARTSEINKIGSDPGELGPRGIAALRVATMPRAVVVTVIVVLAPTLTDAGLNVTPVPAGNPVAVKLIELTNVPTAAVAIVNVAAWPAVTLCGPVGLDIVKSPTVNVSALDVPPPGVGLKTVTEAVPVAAMSLAGTAAVNCVALPNVVTSAAPFHFTAEVLMKFVPVSVNVKAAPPAVAEEG